MLKHRPSKPNLLSNNQIKKIVTWHHIRKFTYSRKQGQKRPKLLLLKTKTSEEATFNKWQLCAVRAPCTVQSHTAIILNTPKPPSFLSTSLCFRGILRKLLGTIVSVASQIKQGEEGYHCASHISAHIVSRSQHSSSALS